VNPHPTTKRILSFENGCRLTLDKNRLRVDRDSESPVLVPLADIAVIMLDFAATTLTVPLVSALVAEDVAIVFCNERHLPVASAIGFGANERHAGILRRQVAATEPTKKRVWQQIVQAKVRNQAVELFRFAREREQHTVAKQLVSMVDQVKSGDSTNIEAQAAVKYFPAMFGADFRRNNEADEPDQQRQNTINAMLNYGYAIVRAAMARAICGAGLHPAFGLFHRNANDAYALADDLMEPIRPLIDRQVLLYLSGAAGEVRWTDFESGLRPQQKRWLLAALTASCTLGEDRLPLLYALELYAADLRRQLIHRTKSMACPAEFVVQLELGF